MNRRWGPRFLAFALVLLIGCGAGPAEREKDTEARSTSQPDKANDQRVTVAEAAEAYLRAVLAEDYGSAYTYLHPGQQTLIGRDLFIRCDGDFVGGLSGDISGVEANGNPKPNTVPGTDVEGEFLQVEIRGDFTSNGKRFDVVAVNTWTMGAGTAYVSVSNIDPYLDGGCPPGV